MVTPTCAIIANIAIIACCNDSFRRILPQDRRHTLIRRCICLDQCDVFRLGRDGGCKTSAGNWCAADDRLDSGPIHDKTHSMLLSSAVAKNAKSCC